MLGGAEEFKQQHLGGTDDYPIGSQAIEGNLLILFGTGIDGVGNDLDFQAPLEQIHGGLEDTDVGFNAAEHRGIHL
jgi:hypothetical protein